MGAITTNSILKSIGISAFRDCDQFSGDLIIPESVNEIGQNAFQNCSSFNGILRLPNNKDKVFDFDKLTRINVSTFQGCNGFVGDLKLPDNGFKEVYNNAFKDCGGFTSLTRGEDQTLFGTSSFENCVGLNNILDLQGAVRNIYSLAFRNCKNLAGVKLGGKIRNIGDQAFSGCSSMEGGIFLNSNITLVGESAFRDCSSLSYIESKAPVANLGQNALRIQSQTTSDKLLYVPDNKFESYRVAGNPNNYYDGNLLLRLRDNVQQTEYYNASRVVIASGLFEEIPEKWQSGNNGHFLEIGASVNKIEKHAFRDNLNLKGTIVIPGTVKNLETACFRNCPNVTDFLIGEGLENIRSQSFRDSDGLTNIKIPTSVEIVGSLCFNGCVNLTKITIKDPVRVGNDIGGTNSSFNTCHSLRNVTIGNSSLSKLERGFIGPYAFKGCGRDVTNGKVTINSSINSIETHAFDGGAANDSYAWIRDLTIAAKTIKERAFQDQTRITGLILEEPVRRIRDQAFKNCSSLLEIDGRGVRNVHFHAFSGCSEITRCQFGNNTEDPTDGQILKDAMRGVGKNYSLNNGVNVKIGRTIKSINLRAFKGDFNWIKKANLQCRDIKNDAFINQSSLKTLETANKRVQRIGEKSFKNCINLTSDLTLDYKGIEIGFQAFDGCPVGHVFIDTPASNVSPDAFSNAMVGNIYVLNATSQGWTIGAGTGPGGNNVYNWNNHPAYIPN